MKIKTKLRLGFGFLFAIVIFFGSVSLFYVNEIAKSSRVILKDNYETLNYVRGMRKVLDQHPQPLQASGIKEFNLYLNKEEHNVTEPGEQAAVNRVEQAFHRLVKPGSSSISALNRDQADLRAALLDIEVINMNAIVRKNDAAQASVRKTTLLLGLAATFTFLILFSFSVNFPGFISGPLIKLSEGITEIMRKNYSTRIEFWYNDEFADVAKSFNEMVARLQEWENSNLATVLSDKRRIEAIIEQMQDAIIGVNEKQEIIFMNAAGKKILNLNQEPTKGVIAKEVGAENDLFRSIIDEKIKDKPFKIVVDGKEFHFRLETREIFVPNMHYAHTDDLALATQPAGKVYILENITEFKERDEAKTNFIATISHELKTPISSIKMSLQLLSDKRVGLLNQEQTQLVAHIQEDNYRLLKITSELLELAQVETGNIQLNLVPANPAQIVNYAIGAVQFQANQKNVKIEFIQEPHLPQVQVDIEKTAWVLVNFLSNALRYSPDKSDIIIQVKTQGNMVEFSVKDFGKGIEEQFQQRLFDRYFQVPTDGQNKAGSGLGLAISKDFIEVQQGRIGMESSLGEGSRFFFQLPAYKFID